MNTGGERSIDDTRVGRINSQLLGDLVIAGGDGEATAHQIDERTSFSAGYGKSQGHRDRRYEPTTIRAFPIKNRW